LEHNLKCSQATKAEWWNIAPSLLNEADVTKAFDDETLKNLARKAKQEFGC
jgi:hypothetical protein